MTVELTRYFPLVPPAWIRYAFTSIAHDRFPFGLIAAFLTVTVKLLALYPIGVLFEDRIMFEVLSIKSTLTAK